MNLSLRAFIPLLFAGMMACGWTERADGASYLIDFGRADLTTTQEGVIWNNFTDATGQTALTLLSTTGVASSYQLASSGTFNSNGEAYLPAQSVYPITAERDFFYQTSNRSLTLSGLDKSLAYDIKLFGFIYRPDSRLVRVTINGVTQNYEAGFSETTNPSGGTTVFSGLTPNASGQIVMNFSSGVGNNIILNVMELHSVPEPEMGLLLGIGIAMSLCRRRRPTR